MQLATSASVPLPDSSSALQTTRSELKAMPATPTPLLALAAIVPATCVPLSVVVDTLAALQQVLEARAGDGLPAQVRMGLVDAGVDDASMSASTTPPLWPVLWSPYCSPKRGSLGNEAARRIVLGSAYATKPLRFSCVATAAASPRTR